LFVVFGGKKQSKHAGKMPKICKKFNSEIRSDDHIKIKGQQNLQILKSQVSAWSRISSLECWSFWWSLGLECCVLDYITVY